MIIKLDIFGQPINEGDHIACSRNHDKSEIYVFKVISFTPTGMLRLKGKTTWGREKLANPELEAIKITKEQFEAAKH